MPRDPLTPAERRMRGTRPRHRTGTEVHQIRLIAPPRAPKDLGSDGRRSWRRFAGAPWLIESDYSGIADLCRLIDLRSQLDATIKRDGIVVKGSRGQPVAHPLYRTRHQIEGEILALLHEFGFSPLGRRRLGIAIARPSDPDPAERFLAHGRSAQFPPSTAPG